MVSQLKYFRQDPMAPKKKRGAGYYYYRGNLDSGTIPGFAGGDYWSKYNPKKDASQAHLPKKVKNIGKKEEKAPHKADYKTRRARAQDQVPKMKVPGGYVKKRKTTRAGKGPRGYF